MYWFCGLSINRVGERENKSNVISTELGVLLGGVIRILVIVIIRF